VKKSNHRASATPRRAAGVDVRLARTRDAVVVEVADTGAGIAPEHLPHVFERFYRAAPARRRGGTGLGLAIVKAIADADGGSVDARSEVGGGTTFTVRLPASRASARGAVDGPDTLPMRDLSPGSTSFSLRSRCSRPSAAAMPRPAEHEGEHHVAADHEVVAPVKPGA